MTSTRSGHRVETCHMAGDGTGGADGRRTGDGRAATTVARTWERRSGRIGGFHVAVLSRFERLERLGNRHGGRRGRGGGRATDGRRTGDDDGGEGVEAPQWEDRRVPCERDAMPSRGSRGAAIAMTVDGDDGDGRADEHDGCGGRRGGAGAPERRGRERRAACFQISDVSVVMM